MGRTGGENAKSGKRLTEKKKATRADAISAKAPGPKTERGRRAASVDRSPRKSRATVRGVSPPKLAESPSERAARFRKILPLLRKAYPDAECALRHEDPWQLLVATILSAQSTDEMVNKVTPELFAAYPTPRELAAADPTDVERIVHRTGFFRQKTKSIIGAARKIVEEFGGNVPDKMDALVTLPGVARKTANVVLGTAFGKNEGVVVDTHIGRVATRLGLTWTGRDGKDAVRIEQDLMQVIPRPEWTYVGHALIWHGRKVCSARRPNCAGCTLNRLCPSAGNADGP